ncbi:eyes absent homolog 3 isoform X1 [Alosa sapidissima]|uniref:eyes absent homolog 3 isoform X1 n=1 Tax=Alosa sapidissima TaxID=34773 RepID=UPI001C085956|nr:eyes absent homolog 3 isoform X1 [Alosa sapidissima]
MDESQDLAELPKKKARHEPGIGQEGQQAVVTNEDTDSAERNDSAALGSEVNTPYPPSSVPHLDAVSGSSEQSSQDTGTGNQTCDTDNSYTNNAVTCKDLTTTTGTEYTSQIYQGSNPAVTAYASQGAFSLTQSSVYGAFPQTGQTYGLPPFGAMWPGIKTETGLPEAPSVGQPGFLSFSTAYTSTQPGQAHYSYPSQGSCFTTSSVYTNIPTANVTATTTAAAPGNTQEFTSYNSLNQIQFPQYYVPPTSYLPSGLPSTDGDVSGVVAAAAYPGAKDENAVPAGLPNTTDPSPGVALPTGAREQDDASRRNPPGKSKGKAKKAENSQSIDNDLERIFLWDLDETIIIFHSLLTGTFAQKFGKDPATVLNLGLQMEELIFELADTHLFFNDLEECDQVHVEDIASDDNGQDLSNYNFSTDGFTGPSGGGGSGPTAAVQGGVEWMRKLAFRYRRLKEIYNAYKGNAGGLLSPMKRDLLLRLRTEIETVTDSWLSIALKSLLLIQSRGRCMNVLVTTTQLVPALAKVLLYGLGEVFPIENIYSATKIGKESCFERIVSRFGKKVTYVVIGDGRDEEFAAKQHNMPFWRVSAHGDLVSLHQALELDFL